MALVPYVEPDALDEQYRPLLERPITLFRGLANSPEGFSKFHAIGEWIRWDCELDPRLRELLILFVGYITRSPYEWSHHIQLSRQFGVTDADIEGVIRHAEGEPSGLSELDELILDAGREITERHEMTPQTWEALAAHFPPGRMVDITIVAAFYNMVVRVLGTLKIDVEPEYAIHLERFPLPGTYADTAGS